MSFQTMYSKNITGMIEYAGNTLGLNGACTSFNSVYQGCNSPGTSGIAGAWITTDTTSHASSNWLTFVNNLPAASTNGGTTFDCTKNSSSDTISVPPNTEIDYAVLIWSGNNGSSTVDVSTRPINFTTPTKTVNYITPIYTSLSPTNDGYYTCCADVTSIVASSTNGTYTVGNVYSEFRSNLASAGWLLVVVYKAPFLGFINININVGSLDVSDGSSASQELSGFITSDRGTTNAGILICALNGNPSSAGDNISLTNNEGMEAYLYSPSNPIDNFFGSQILDMTGKICIDGTFGNLNATPASIQTAAGRRVGFDVALVDASHALSNNQTSTTLTASSTGNGYYINSILSLIVNATPQIELSATTPKTTISLGDNYNVSYILSNKGTLHTDSMNFTFDDTGLNFISGSYTLSGSTIVNTIVSNPNNLSIANLEPSQSMLVNLTYKSNKIPNNLLFNNLGTFNYTFASGSDEILSTIQATIPISISSLNTISITNAQTVSSTVPLVSPTLPNLSYTVSLEPTKGQISVSSQGVITYVPNGLIKDHDNFTINVVDSISKNSMDLLYLVNLDVVSTLEIVYKEIPSVATLGSTVDYVYEFNNKSNYDISNCYVIAAIAPGYILESAKYTNLSGRNVDILRTGSNFTIGTLPANKTITVAATYIASSIPTDLFYQNLSDIQYTFGGIQFYMIDASDNVPVIANLSFNIYNTSHYSNRVPIIDPNYPYLSYSIKTQGSLGTSSIDNSGNFRYIPSSSAVGSDSVVVNIANSQHNNTMDINYTFNITAPSTIPCSQSIPSKLLYLLENDIYLNGLEVANINANVCFDCDLWNNGYTSFLGDLIIHPIKSTFNSLLLEIKAYLQNILIPTGESISCNDYGFKSQVDRVLNIVNDLENKTSSFTCSTQCCNPSLNGQFLDLLSQSVTNLITIITSIDGAIEICNSSCSNCSAFDKLMPTLVNSISDLGNLMVLWNYLLMNFMSCMNSSTKPYVASYIPNRQISVPPPNQYCINCPPNNKYR